MQNIYNRTIRPKKHQYLDAPYQLQDTQYFSFTQIPHFGGSYGNKSSEGTMSKNKRS